MLPLLLSYRQIWSMLHIAIARNYYLREQWPFPKERKIDRFDVHCLFEKTEILQSLRKSRMSCIITTYTS